MSREQTRCPAQCPGDTGLFMAIAARSPLLGALPQKCAGLPAAQSRRRLHAGAAFGCMTGATSQRRSETCVAVECRSQPVAKYEGEEMHVCLHVNAEAKKAL